MTVGYETQIDGPDIYHDDLPAGPILTGDVFTDLEGSGGGASSGVVLTPMCDLAHDKCEWVKLALALPFSIYLAEVFIPERLKSTKEYREEILKNPSAFGKVYLEDKKNREVNMTWKLVKELKRILENLDPRKLSLYYLPGKETKERDKGFIVDFSHIFSARFQSLKERTPLLRLKSPWREQLLNRYVSFSLRIGTPDYSEDSISQTIQAFFPELSVEDIKKKMK